MTLDEAKKLANCAATADGGCSVCVADMCNELSSTFPEFVWRLNDDGNVVVEAAEKAFSGPSAPADHYSKTGPIEEFMTKFKELDGGRDRD